MYGDAELEFPGSVEPGVICRLLMPDKLLTVSISVMSDILLSHREHCSLYMCVCEFCFCID